MSVTNSQFIDISIRDLARKYFRDNPPYSAGIAPLLQPTAAPGGMSFIYPFVDGDAGDVVLTAGVPTLANETSTLTPLSMSLGERVVTLDRIDLGVFGISDFSAAAFAAANGEEFASDAVSQLLERASVMHSVSTRDIALAQLDDEDIALDNDFDEAFTDALVEVRLRSNQDPNTILMAYNDVKAMSRLDFIRDYPSVSVAFDNGSEAGRRSGYATDAQVASYFADKHGLRLIVDKNAYRTGASDPRQFVWSGKACVGRVGDGFGLSTLKTFVQMNGDILRTEVRRNSGTLGIGESIAAEGAWKVEAVAPETGLILDLAGGASS
jgi:hypothetical protein